MNNYYQGAPDAPAAFAGPRQAQGAVWASGVSPKSKLVTLILWFFLGIFGAHRFYIGNYVIAVVYLLTFGLLGFGWLVDLVLLLLDRLRDRNGLPVAAW